MCPLCLTAAALILTGAISTRGSEALKTKKISPMNCTSKLSPLSTNRRHKEKLNDRT
jgi:hypothetical protein